MRRLVCFVLCCMFLFSTVAVAEAAEEIKFRGVEWGSDHQTVKATFAENVSWKKPKSSSAYSLEYELTGNYRGKQFYKGPVSCVAATKFYYNNLEVAGYPVTEAKLYFAYTADDSGSYAQELDRTALYMAYYSFVDLADPAAANEDLIGKLIQLYGEPTEVSTEEGTDYPDEYRRWNGANDTTCVYLRKYTTDYDIIEIHYGWFGGEQLLSDAYDYYAALAAEEQASSAEAAGTDGL